MNRTGEHCSSRLEMWAIPMIGICMMGCYRSHVSAEGMRVGPDAARPVRDAAVADFSDARRPSMDGSSDGGFGLWSCHEEETIVHVRDGSCTEPIHPTRIPNLCLEHDFGLVRIINGTGGPAEVQINAPEGCDGVGCCYQALHIGSDVCDCTDGAASIGCGPFSTSTPAGTISLAAGSESLMYFLGTGPSDWTVRVCAP
jgi:hypothetical protein